MPATVIEGVVAVYFRFTGSQTVEILVTCLEGDTYLGQKKKRRDRKARRRRKRNGMEKKLKDTRLSVNWS